MPLILLQQPVVILNTYNIGLILFSKFSISKILLKCSKDVLIHHYKHDFEALELAYEPLLNEILKYHSVQNV